MRCVHCSQESEFDSAYCRFCGAPIGGAAPFSRRLLRRPDEGQVAGVCAGVAHYLKVDVTVVRLLWVFLTIVPGAIIGGVIAYAAAWMLMPEATDALSEWRRRGEAVPVRNESQSRRRVWGPGCVLQGGRDDDQAGVRGADHLSRRHHRRRHRLRCRLDGDPPGTACQIRDSVGLVGRGLRVGRGLLAPAWNGRRLGIRHRPA